MQSKAIRTTVQDLSRATFAALTLSPAAPAFFNACENLMAAIETPAAFAALIKKYAYDAALACTPGDDPRRNNFNSIVAMNALAMVDWVYLADLYWHDFKIGRMAIYAPQVWQLTKPVEAPAAPAPALDWSHVETDTPQDDSTTHRDLWYAVEDHDL